VAKGKGDRPDRIELKPEPRFGRLLRVAAAIEGKPITEIVKVAVEEHYANSPIWPEISALLSAAS
jgi:uncharacterized protein (DUF1778 family)